MALRLGKLCGNGPEFWLGLPMLRDLWHMERTLAAGLAPHPDPPRRVSQVAGPLLCYEFRSA